MFVLSLNAFRQRCFHNFPTSIRKFIASNFFDRDCVAVHSLCVCVCLCHYASLCECNFPKLIRLNRFAHRTPHNLF